MEKLFAVYTLVVLLVYFNEPWIHTVIVNYFLPENETKVKRFSVGIDYHFFNASDYYIFATVHFIIGGYFSIELIVCVDLLVFWLSEHTCCLYKILK